jgi:hypothetical protein
VLIEISQVSGNLLREFLERIGPVAFPANGVDPLKIYGVQS